jgi:hypothetical protein
LRRIHAHVLDQLPQSELGAVEQQVPHFFAASLLPKL